MKSKRLLSFVLAVLMVISAIPATVVTVSAANESVAQTGITGSGTEKDPYIINTSADLYGLFHSDKNMHVKLGQDISVTSTIYVASDITLDMNGKTIKTTSKTSAFDISQGCNLKIKGTGKIDHTGKMYTFFVRGVLETYGNVVFQCPDDLGSVICLSDYGVARIYGGSFSGQQIALNGGGKMYVYGGNIISEVLVTKATQLYVYDGTFENRIYNYGYLYTYGGEFKKDVSSLSETGEATFYGGHFKEGISNYSTSPGGIHLLGKNSICMAHNNNDVTDDGLFVRTEITVFRPDYAEQTPEIKYNETEYDLGTINSLDEFVVSFKAKDVPKLFADNGYTIEESLVVKDSDGFVEIYDIKSGTKGQGVKLNLGNLTGGDYTVERTIKLYKGSSLKKSNKCIMKITVNPLSSSSFGFATMIPAVSAEDMEDNYTYLPAVTIGTHTLDFGFTPFISSALSDKGFSAKPKVYINYNNQGTIKTLNSCKNFNLMDYVDRTGDYQVWFNISLYNGDEFVTSKTHIYNVPIVLDSVNTLKANVTAPVAGELPDSSVTPAGEGYKTTDVDWSYYDEKYDDYYIMPDGMTFEAGKTYECAVQFEALDEYTFPESKSDIKGYINGIQGVISSVYYKDKAYVTVKFTVPEKDRFEVIFTSESEAQEGKFLEVDLEKMAELSDEFMDAYLNEYVKCQWFLNGSKIDDATNVRFDIPKGYAGKSLYVEVFYGDNSIESDNLLIAQGNSEPTDPESNPLYYVNPDWGKSEEDIIKAVEYTLNSDGTYSADVIVDVDCFDGQVYYYDVEGLGYQYYDHNNKFHGGSVGGAITKPAKDEIRFRIASDLQPGTQWRAKAYLAYDVYADYEIQGYDFAWVNLTVPALPAPAVTGLLGDADCDGKVNVKDATAIQKHVASIITLSETGAFLADVDANTNVNIKDATAIQKWVAGIETGFLIGKEI